MVLRVKMVPDLRNTGLESADHISCPYVGTPALCPAALLGGLHRSDEEFTEYFYTLTLAEAFAFLCRRGVEIFDPLL